MTRSNPTPRDGAYDLYWRFAYERHAAFVRRASGEPGPWTNDPILQEYKFCNTYRALDRVSQYLIREVAYSAESWADRLFQVVAFRLFSKTETWDSLVALLGRPPRISDVEGGALERVLDEVRRLNGGLYTGAFILCATNAYDRPSKHGNHAGLLRDMFVETDGAAEIRAAGSLGGLVRFLEGFPLIGPFMSYQIAIDLNYTDVVDFDEDDFTQAGPGALRGIKKAFTDTGRLRPEEIIDLMVERQHDEFDRLGLPFPGLYGRALHAIDCQGLFCELDKYCREALPELKSARSRIKAKFRPSSEPMDVFLPPKWGLTPSRSKAPGYPSNQNQRELFA